MSTEILQNFPSHPKCSAVTPELAAKTFLLLKNLSFQQNSNQQISAYKNLHSKLKNLKTFLVHVAVIHTYCTYSMIEYIHFMPVTE